MPSSDPHPIRHVVYVHTHDMGRMIAPYGVPVQTPGMSAFAEQGMVFDQAHCAAPTCSPSRAALLTGRYPHEAGMMGLSHRGFSLNDPEEHLGRYLSRRGVRTALCGLQHEFGLYAKGLPYDDVWPNWLDESNEDRDQRAVQDALRFLEKRGFGPTFLSVGLFYPHRPFFSAPPEQRNRPLPEGWPEDEAYREDWADYAGTIEWVDRTLDPLLHALTSGPEAESTLVILTTDHGPPFPDQKGQLRDAGTGVTLIIRHPQGEKGKRTSAMVSHLDLFPTICESLGVPLPPTCRGLSLLPLLQGQPWGGRGEIFTQTTFHAAYEPLRAIRTERYKFIRRFGSTRRVLVNCDDSPAKTSRIKAGWDREILPGSELYDLLDDPGETRNLIQYPKCASIVQDLSERLRTHMEATNDPLLDPPVIPPPGVTLNEE